MAKYSKFERKTPKQRYKIHPIWAGIGFLMIIIVPLISWAAATELVNLERQQHWGLTSGFPIYLQLPDTMNQIPGVSALAGIQNLPAIGTFFLIILFILTSVLSFGYAMIYRMIGPPRYSPEDAPALRIKTKKYKR